MACRRLLRVSLPPAPKAGSRLPIEVAACAAGEIDRSANATERAANAAFGRRERGATAIGATGNHVRKEGSSAEGSG